MGHEDTDRVIRDPRVDFVAFTGSVAGGHAVQRAAAERFVGTGLELGGCDAAYVRHDADVAHAVENLVDGAYFNSGQSCCGIQRVYVHERVLRRLRRGLDRAHPRVRARQSAGGGHDAGAGRAPGAADTILEQIDASIGAGARPVFNGAEFGEGKGGRQYLAPQLLLEVDHSMPVMREEIFGPVAGIMKVASDEAAITLMNDSDFGLTAAIWTARRGCGARDRRPGPGRHVVHESLRLPRSGAGLGRASRTPGADARCRRSVTST